MGRQLWFPKLASRYRNALLELQKKPDSFGMSKRVFIILEYSL